MCRTCNRESRPTASVNLEASMRIDPFSTGIYASYANFFNPPNEGRQELGQGLALVKPKAKDPFEDYFQQPPPLLPIERRHESLELGPFSSQSVSGSRGSSIDSSSPSVSPHFYEKPQETSYVPAPPTKTPGRRGRGKGVGPVKLPCSVCGDLAPDHMHYGGVACFSCRAFFRRSVDKAHTYQCQEQKKCFIDVSTRRNCQFCRYHKCLDSGMKPSWVLTEDEKRERIVKKRANAAKREQEKRNAQVKDRDLVLTSKLSKISLTTLEDSHIEEWLFAMESTRHTITLPTSVAIQVANLTKANNDLDQCSTLELYKVLYSRVVKFTSFLEEFTELTTSDRRLLLSFNLEPVATIRMAACLDPKVPMAQLKELGRPDIPFGQERIRIGQIFKMPWAANQDHVDLYTRVIDGLVALPAFDAKSNLLLQLITLFSTLGLDVKQLEDPGKVEHYQEVFTEQLLKYLRTRVGLTRSNVVIHKYLSFLPLLRILSEMISQKK